MTSPHRTSTVAVAFGFAALLGQQAHAQQSVPSTLFYEGKRLMSEGHYEQACERFRKSNALAPAPGTLANHADCLEKLGRTASAWSQFHKAAELARKEGNAEYYARAEQRAEALEPRLTRLMLEAPERAQGTRVTLDGAPYPPEAIGTKLPVDPGSYEIRAEAEGCRPWSTHAKVAGEGAVFEITVPKLECGAERRTDLLPYVIGGTGIALAGAGAVFGVLALGNDADVDKLCPRHEDCDQPALDAASDRDRNAWLANVGIGLGVVGVGAAAVLWILGGNEEHQPLPRVSVTSRALVLTTEF